MGPPIYIGGNGMRGVVVQGLQDMLQWGHRFISVETCGARRGGPVGRRFNGATDLYRWKLYQRLLNT